MCLQSFKFEAAGYIFLHISRTDHMHISPVCWQVKQEVAVFFPPLCAIEPNVTVYYGSCSNTKCEFDSTNSFSHQALLCLQCEIQSSTRTWNKPKRHYSKLNLAGVPCNFSVLKLLHALICKLWMSVMEVKWPKLKSTQHTVTIHFIGGIHPSEVQTRSDFLTPWVIAPLTPHTHTFYFLLKFYSVYHHYLSSPSPMERNYLSQQFYLHLVRLNTVNDIEQSANASNRAQVEMLFRE